LTLIIDMEVSGTMKKKFIDQSYSSIFDHESRYSKLLQSYQPLAAEKDIGPAVFLYQVFVDWYGSKKWISYHGVAVRYTESNLMYFGKLWF
jgi:hypothetical protein